MGFDPITLALAKAYTDSKTEGGGGGGGPAVIDLTKYEVPEGFTINDAVLAMFAQGGGNTSGTFPTSFWNDVNTDKKVKFVIDASTLGVIIEADAASVMKDESGVVVSIETSFIAMMQDVGYKVTIVFNAILGLLVSVDTVYGSPTV